MKPHDENNENNLKWVSDSYLGLRENEPVFGTDEIKREESKDLERFDKPTLYYF